MSLPPAWNAVTHRLATESAGLGVQLPTSLLPTEPVVAVITVEVQLPPLSGVVQADAFATFVAGWSVVVKVFVVPLGCPQLGPGNSKDGGAPVPLGRLPQL